MLSRDIVPLIEEAAARVYAVLRETPLMPMTEFREFRRIDIDIDADPGSAQRQLHARVDVGLGQQALARRTAASICSGPEMTNAAASLPLKRA
jgi:hypothetical protein